MVRFLAEIAFRSSTSIQATPNPTDMEDPAGVFPKNYTIYELDIGPPPESSYWLEWDEGYGEYDEYTGTQIELYFGQFLQHVTTSAELLAQKYALLLAGTMVYFNIPKHPWLYANYAIEGEDVIPFLSSSLDPDNPSRNQVRGVSADVRLEVPHFTVKLSDNISGVVLNQGFSLALDNHDGFFDNDDEWDLFNTPVHLKKAIVENPSYEDFREIRIGYAGSTRVVFDTFTIDVLDKLRSMEEPVCGIINQADFPSVVLDPGVIGKSIPVIYGTKKVKLIKLDDANNYLGAESVSSVPAVYDKDGNEITGFTVSGNVINAANADTALITGYTANAIGEIIRDVIARKTAVQYSASNWNRAETDSYIAASPPVNIVFSQGNVKKAVDDVLRSDMAYFIQQTDGRFTIRKYGETYGTHIIPSWAVTKKPEKDFNRAQENYFSSCLIKYNFTETDRNTFNELYYNEQEAAAEDRYRKRLFREYETDLVNKDDAYALAVLLGNRHTVMRQHLKLSVGIDTMGMELLDTVTMDVTINGRRFSNAVTFIITELDQAQDILTLEEL
jgi:hypothetical protein